MSFNLQPKLKNDMVEIVPLKAEDFEKLYQVAADPLMWLQHPNKNRYKKAEFTIFFTGAMESGGAFLIYDAKTHDIIGSSRYYDWNEKEKSIAIGYTFFAITHWKKGYNSAAKQLMIEHAFQFADKILFHVGSKNKRSQIAIERLGVVKIEEREMKYHGEEESLNFIYELTPKLWKEYLERREEAMREEKGKTEP